MRKSNPAAENILLSHGYSPMGDHMWIKEETNFTTFVHYKDKYYLILKDNGQIVGRTDDIHELEDFV